MQYKIIRNYCPASRCAGICTIILDCFGFLKIINDPPNSGWPEAYKKQSIVYGFVQWHLKDLD